jgi:hypothetical protein
MSPEEMDWKKLCELVSKESDPQRLSELLEQLIEALDARRAAFESNSQPRRPSADSSPTEKSRLQ